MMKKLSILVVDDDIDNASSLGELFEMEGHDVRVVHSGEAAIAAYIKGSFDVAFMDVMMPGKNGVESFLEIRRLKPKARVFMMTGYSVEELLQQAMRGGALGVLEKPFDAAEVLRLTESVGPGGLVLTQTAQRGTDVGGAIQSALSQSGRVCSIVRRPGELTGLSQDDVLVIDADIPLIDEVSVLTDIKKQGHRGPSILVSPHREQVSSELPLLRDVGVTGILNKPFDPFELLNRLHFLAA
ncbi:MAG: response regulator transcription factor [Phyllobacteriaceae bacterium]|nr:response regulator transcription factor [Phyllobacteriaceae bacterium]